MITYICVFLFTFMTPENKLVPDITHPTSPISTAMRTIILNNDTNTSQQKTYFYISRKGDFMRVSVDYTGLSSIRKIAYGGDWIFINNDNGIDNSTAILMLKKYMLDTTKTNNLFFVLFIQTIFLLYCMGVGAYYCNQKFEYVPPSVIFTVVLNQVLILIEIMCIIFSLREFCKSHLSGYAVVSALFFISTIISLINIIKIFKHFIKNKKCKVEESN